MNSNAVVSDTARSEESSPLIAAISWDASIMPQSARDWLGDG